MVITCTQCGRPVAELDTPAFSPAHVSIVRRFLSGVNLDLGAQLETLLNPTPETITSTFNVRCTPGCQPVAVRSHG